MFNCCQNRSKLSKTPKSPRKSWLPILSITRLWIWWSLNFPWKSSAHMAVLNRWPTKLMRSSTRPQIPPTIRLPRPPRSAVALLVPRTNQRMSLPLLRSPKPLRSAAALLVPRTSPRMSLPLLRSPTLPRSDLLTNTLANPRGLWLLQLPSSATPADISTNTMSYWHSTLHNNYIKFSYNQNTKKYKKKFRK